MFKLSNKNEIKDSKEVIKNASKKTAVPSIINAEMSIKGDVVSDNIIEIIGKLEGNITAEVVSIREGSLVKGNITARYVTISGTFEGEVHSSIIHITPSGCVKGRLTYGMISIEEKARFNGTLDQKSDLLEIKPIEVKENKEDGGEA